MRKNVGGVDRSARLVIGAGLVLLGIAGYAGLVVLAVGPVPQALASGFVFLVGAILVATGALQWCPINSLFGVDTYRSETSEDRDSTNRTG